MENHARLTDWVVRNGGYLHPNMEIVHSFEKGYHGIVRTGTRVNALTRVSSCPTSVMLSVLNALDIDPFSSRGTKFPRAFIMQSSPTIVHNFFLMEQYLLGQKSWWHPYLATLPTPAEVEGMQFTGERDLAFLQGTNLSFAVEKQKRQWQEMYAKGLDHLRKLNWANATSYSFELFQWAAVIFASRSFTSQVLSATLPADRASPIADQNGLNQWLTQLFSDGFPVLLPLVDLLNHKPCVKVEWQARFSFLGLQVLERFESGQELCNNYGPRDNETLLLSYYFTIPENPFDHFSVSLRIPPNSPVMQTRLWDKTRAVGSEYHLFVFNSNHPRATKASCVETSLFSFDLLDTMSVLFANDREMSSMILGQQTLMNAALRKSGKFDDHRNLYAVISQLRQDCKVKAASLHNSDASQVPQTLKQKYAQIYRVSQEHILETAVCLSETILFRSLSDKTASEILQTFESQHYFVTETLTNVRALVENLSFWTKNNELFTYERLLGTVSYEAQTRWQRCISEIESETLRLQHEDSSRPENGHHLMQDEYLDKAKVGFAILLALLVTEYTRGQLFTQRIRSWMSKLTSWYPPDDSNWSYVPDDKPRELEEAQPPALMSLLASARRLLAVRSLHRENDIARMWQDAYGEASQTNRMLKPEIICWGWNVMEEEGITVPLHMVDGNRVFDWNDNARSFVLFIPHL